MRVAGAFSLSCCPKTRSRRTSDRRRARSLSVGLVSVKASGRTPVWPIGGRRFKLSLSVFLELFALCRRDASDGPHRLPLTTKLVAMPPERVDAPYDSSPLVPGEHYVRLWLAEVQTARRTMAKRADTFFIP